MRENGCYERNSNNAHGCAVLECRDMLTGNHACKLLNQKALHNVAARQSPSAAAAATAACLAASMWQNKQQ